MARDQKSDLWATGRESKEHPIIFPPLPDYDADLRAALGIGYDIGYPAAVTAARGEHMTLIGDGATSVVDVNPWNGGGMSWSWDGADERMMAWEHRTVINDRSDIRLREWHSSSADGIAGQIQKAIDSLYSAITTQFWRDFAPYTLWMHPYTYRMLCGDEPDSLTQWELENTWPDLQHPKTLANALVTTRVPRVGHLRSMRNLLRLTNFGPLSSGSRDWRMKKLELQGISKTSTPRPKVPVSMSKRFARSSQCVRKTKPRDRRRRQS